MLFHLDHPNRLGRQHRPAPGNKNVHAAVGGNCAHLRPVPHREKLTHKEREEMTTRQKKGAIDRTKKKRESAVMMRRAYFHYREISTYFYWFVSEGGRAGMDTPRDNILSPRPRPAATATATRLMHAARRMRPPHDRPAVALRLCPHSRRRSVVGRRPHSPLAHCPEGGGRNDSQCPRRWIRRPSWS